MFDPFVLNYMENTTCGVTFPKCLFAWQIWQSCYILKCSQVFFKDECIASVHFISHTMGHRAYICFEIPVIFHCHPCNKSINKLYNLGWRNIVKNKFFKVYRGIYWFWTKWIFKKISKVKSLIIVIDKNVKSYQADGTPRITNIQ